MLRSCDTCLSLSFWFSHLSNGESCYYLIGMLHELNKMNYVKPICKANLQLVGQKHR